MTTATFNLLLILLTSALAGWAKSIQDELNFYYDKSIFSTWKNKSWFGAPQNTWNNKNTISSNPILKWLFNGPLVFVTDAWHFFDFIRNMAIPTALAYITNHWWWLLWYWMVFSTIFDGFFAYIWQFSLADAEGEQQLPASASKWWNKVLAVVYYIGFFGGGIAAMALGGGYWIKQLVIFDTTHLIFIPVEALGAILLTWAIIKLLPVIQQIINKFFG